MSHPRGLVRLSTLLVLGGIWACDPLEVNDPDIIDRDALNSLEGAGALYAGALGDFASARDGNTAFDPPVLSSFGIISAGGVFSDEFQASDVNPHSRELDLRSTVDGNLLVENVYLHLHRARESAERAAKLLTDLVAAGADRDRPVTPGTTRTVGAAIGEMHAISAFTYVLLGEHFCSGIPFSTVEPTVTFGQPLTTVQVFEAALQGVALAQQNSNGDTDIDNLSRVLEGRSLLNLGRFPEAAAAVAAVPDGFSYGTLHSDASDRETNGVFFINRATRFLVVADAEGTNGLDFVSAGDPRVPTLQAGVGPDGLQWNQFLGVASASSPIVAADGIEARLIEAEAALQVDDFSTWLGMLNTARATLGMLDLLDPGAPSARVDLMFRERAFWMFATGHRVGDLRRLIREYGRDPSTVLPTGAYKGGGQQYGSDLVMRVPLSEQNNPNFSGCLDIGA